MLFQYRPAQALVQLFPEQQLQATITEKHFTEHRDKAAVRSRQLLSPDRNFPSDPWEVLRSLFRMIGRLCRSRCFPAQRMMLQSFGVHYANIWSHFSTSLLGLWWREIFYPLRRGKELALSHDSANLLLSLSPILFFSSINAFITYCNNSFHPLFLFVLVFILLI